MINVVFTWAFFFAVAPAFATEVASSFDEKRKSTHVSVAQQAIAELGNCKPARSEEESTARKLAEAQGLSKEEILARLIFSEALSTGYWNERCNAESADAILTSIGWGTINRVKIKSTTNLDTYSDVIFGRKQYSTSFSGKKTNPFAESFLCPLKSQHYLDRAKKKVDGKALFAKSRTIAHEIVHEFESSGIPPKYRGITNFFYPQSEYFGEIRPTWAANKDPQKNRGYINLLGEKSKPCVEFYRLK